jgi:hypothetical protein
LSEPYVPGRHASGGAAYLAREVIGAARARIQPQQPVLPPSLIPKPERPDLTEADRRALGELIQGGGGCEHCGGAHAGTELACPRLASFELDGDRKIRAGTYWAPGSWENDRWVAAEEAAEPGPAEAAGDDPAV